MEKNAVKARLLAGEHVTGLFVKTADPVIAEILALCGVDFVVCDAEHGASSARDFEGFCRAVEVRGAAPFIRVNAADRSLLSRGVDAGALGMHIPWVNDAGIARDIVAATKYLPLGIRGLAGTRASHYGIGVSLLDYMPHANQETLIVAQIESREAVDNVESIAAVPGIDVIFIGPTDLSNSLGVPLDLESEELKRHIEHVAETALRHKKIFGIFVRDRAEAEYWAQRGARYFITNFEALAAKAVKEFIRRPHGV
jgi:4-hydroxy-2-oxoheptanedioate aldolase